MSEWTLNQRIHPSRPAVAATRSIPSQYSSRSGSTLRSEAIELPHLISLHLSSATMSCRSCKTQSSNSNGLCSSTTHWPRLSRNFLSSSHQLHLPHFVPPYIYLPLLLWFSFLVPFSRVKGLLFPCLPLCQLPTYRCQVQMFRRHLGRHFESRDRICGDASDANETGTRVARADVIGRTNGKTKCSKYCKYSRCHSASRKFSTAYIQDYSRDWAENTYWIYRHRFAKPGPEDEARNI